VIQSSWKRSRSNDSGWSKRRYALVIDVDSEDFPTVRVLNAAAVEIHVGDDEPGTEERDARRVVNKGLEMVRMRLPFGSRIATSFRDASVT
jgi:hypothetical protein